MFLNRRCKRVRATEHAPHGPSRVLERIHGLAEIVKRGLVVVVELSPAPRRRSVDSSSLRDDTTVVATAARAPTASATRSSSSSSPRARLSTATAHTGSEASCALFDRFVRAPPGLQPSEPNCSAALFWATRPPFAPTRAATICGWLLRARPRRFRLSSTKSLLNAVTG